MLCYQLDLATVLEIRPLISQLPFVLSLDYVILYVMSNSMFIIPFPQLTPVKQKVQTNFIKILQIIIMFASLFEEKIMMLFPMKGAYQTKNTYLCNQ